MAAGGGCERALFHQLFAGRRGGVCPAASRSLVGGPPSYPVWLDMRDLQPGADWDTQIREALQACRAVLFVMTADSVQDHSFTGLSGRGR